MRSKRRLSKQREPDLSFVEQTAEAIALQASKLKLQPLDLGQRRAQDQLQRGRIVGQVRGGGEHTGTLDYRCQSVPMNPA